MPKPPHSHGHLNRTPTDQDIDAALIKTLEHLGSPLGCLVTFLPTGSHCAYARHPENVASKALCYGAMIDALENQVLPFLRARLEELPKPTDG